MASEQELISKYIDLSRGKANARVHHGAVPVWAIIGYLDAVKGDKARVARDYDLYDHEVEAAIAYYEQHKAAIDARIDANAVA